jgi:hypothetical protein
MGSRVEIRRRMAGIHRPETPWEQLPLLGVACFFADRGGYGWRFYPADYVDTDPKFYPTWEASLPPWVGYPDGCECQYRLPPGLQPLFDLLDKERTKPADAETQEGCRKAA